MKKLMIGLVGALAMVASAEVASSNIVGFDTKEIVSGNYNMFSVPFKMMGKDGFSINKNLSLKNATSSDNSGDSDMIQIWNANTSGYKFYYLYEGDEAPTGWYNLSFPRVLT